VATALVDEVTAADALLLTVPLYNWGTPAVFKSWIDHVFNEPRIAGVQASSAGKHAVLVSARCGSYARYTTRRPGPPGGTSEACAGAHLGLELSPIIPEFKLALPRAGDLAVPAVIAHDTACVLEAVGASRLTGVMGRVISATSKPASAPPRGSV
jgi:Flavodoxin-like fold